MKKMKKLLFVLVALCTLCAMLAVPAAAEDLVIDPELIFNPQTTLTACIEGVASDALSGNYPYGETVTISAPAIADKTFLYWTGSDGTVISYRADLTLIMYANTAVNAVYGTSDATAKTTAAFLNVTRTDGEIVFNAIASANEGITEAGIRYSTTKKTLNDLKGSADVTVEKADGTSTNWTLIVTPDDENTNYYAVAYATVGAETTYSAVKEVKLSELRNGVSMVLNLGDLDLSNLNAEFCVITFDSNGGEGAMAPQGVVAGSETALNANTFTREGYNFIGWRTGKNGGTSYKDGDTVTLSENTTLYAQWENPRAKDELAVAEVTEKINALPESNKVTKSDKNAIEEARKAYDALTDDQKAMISSDTLKKLTDAEKALAPKTGDNSHMGLWITIMILSLCALATMLFIGKKKRVFDR